MENDKNLLLVHPVDTECFTYFFVLEFADLNLLHTERLSENHFRRKKTNGNSSSTISDFPKVDDIAGDDFPTSKKQGPSFVLSSALREKIHQDVLNMVQMAHNTTPPPSISWALVPYIPPDEKLAKILSVPELT